MINVKNNKVDARDLHTALKVGQDFTSWFKRKANDADLREGVDFTTRVGESTGGRPTNDFELTLNAAKEICLLQRSPIGKELRQYLLKLDDKVQNFELITTQQAGYMIRVVNCLQYITNQKQAFDLHQNSYLTSNPEAFKEFAMYRSAITGWTKQKVEEAFNQWLIEQGRVTSKLKSMSDRTNAMDHPEAIRVAVMDILYASGNESELAQKFGQAIKRMAQEMGVKPERTNEANLFHDKQKVLEINQIKLIQ